MAFIKTKCPCGDLYISDTYGGGDFICDRDGKLCNAANYTKDGDIVITTPLNCEHHNNPNNDTLDALKEAKEGKYAGTIDTSSMEAFLKSCE